MLWFLLAALGALLLLVVAALATPVKVAIRARTSPRWHLTIGARLFGGLAPPIPIHDSARRSAKGKRRAAGRKAPALSRRARGRIPRAIAAAPGLLVRLLRAVRFERLAVDADVGLADPADTGHLFGLIAAANHARSPNPAIAVSVRPDFSGPRAAGELEAVLSCVPAVVLAAGAWFAWRVFGPAA